MGDGWETNNYRHTSSVNLESLMHTLPVTLSHSLLHQGEDLVVVYQPYIYTQVSDAHTQFHYKNTIWMKLYNWESYQLGGLYSLITRSQLSGQLVYRVVYDGHCLETLGGH